MSSGSRSGSARWHCARTHARDEHRAHRELAAQGFQPYLPLHLDLRTRQIEPLFPCYVFVAFDAARDPWGAIRSTSGVARLICLAAGQPTALPAGIIEDLIRRTSWRGVVDDPGETRPRLPPGATGEVLGGPLAGWRGVCTMNRRDRCWLLVTMFGREIAVEVPQRTVIDAAA